MPIINQIAGGKKPTGTKNIVANGTHNVADYEYADVQVPTTVPDYYISFNKDGNRLVRSSHLIDFSNITTLDGNWLFNYLYSNVTFPLGTNIDMSQIQTISGNNCCDYMFYTTLGITSADLSGVTTLSGSNCCANMFANSTNLSSIDFSNLTTITANSALSNALYSTRVVNISFPNLTTITGTTVFNNFVSFCGYLESVSFPKLAAFTSFGASYAPFASACPKLQSVSFGGVKASTFASVKNQLQYLFNANTGSTATGGCTVHFPSNFDPSDPNHTFDASTLAGYPTFNGDANYIHVAFDLPATE